MASAEFSTFAGTLRAAVVLLICFQIQCSSTDSQLFLCQEISWSPRKDQIWVGPRVDFQELKQEEEAHSETQVGPGEGLKGEGRYLQGMALGRGWAPKIKVVYSALTLGQSYLCPWAYDGANLSHQDFPHWNKKQPFKNNSESQVQIMHKYHIQLNHILHCRQEKENSVIYLENEGE